MLIYDIVDGKKLYLRRMIYHLPLWHLDPTLAMRMDPQQALTLAEKLRQRWKTVGEIGIEEGVSS